MTIEELRALLPGTRIVYVFGSGSHEERHPTKVIGHKPGYTDILIYFTSKPQAKIRWSAATNRPVGTTGHAGMVTLETG